MHSSGMRTARLLTVSQHALGVCIQGVGCLPRGCLDRSQNMDPDTPPPGPDVDTPPLVDRLVKT